MKKSRQSIKLSSLVLNKGQLEWLPRNPRQWGKSELESLVRSLDEDPDYMEDRPPLVTPCGDKYVVFAANMRITAEKARKARKEIECVVYVPENETDQATIVRRAAKDNGSWGSFDFDILANEWDYLPLTEWGLPAWDTEEAEKEAEKEEEDDEIERMRKEFQAKMEAGELSEDDEEYQEFLAKFEAKKTTDDCYTPDVIYEAVANWVSETYKVSRTKFVRPFYPGGDYEKEKYPAGCVVVDNPPFSILSEILKFYNSRSIQFFLFAPTLTLFSSSSRSSTAIPIAAGIVYANGASVNTSFLTSLGDRSIRVMSSPSLYKAVSEANNANLATMRKSLPKYNYDHHIITSPFVGALSRLGIDFVVPVAESEPILCLDAQKESGKAIFGRGYIVSDRVFAEREKAEREKAEREKAEREKAEREKAEREKAERWELSPRERAIIERLNAAADLKNS